MDSFSFELAIQYVEVKYDEVLNSNTQRIDVCPVQLSFVVKNRYSYFNYFRTVLITKPLEYHEPIE